MKIRAIIGLSFLALLMFVSDPALAANAGLLLSPTRIVLENGERFITVIVRNTGDDGGRYKISMVDAIMDENGGIKVLEDDKKAEFSARGLISLSPSNMTLNPDESQNVRILIKNMSDLPDGEYRSHLQVRMTDSNLKPPEEKPIEKGAGIEVSTKLTTTIPLIIRKGQTSYTVVIDEAKLVTGGGNNNQTPEVKVSMSFSGNRSVLGDFKITHIASDGKETQLAFLPGTAIYRGVAKRNQTVSLKVPEGVNIHSGRMRVSFLSKPEEGSHVLSEKVITP